MENIQLDGIIIEPHYGRNIDKAPALLARWKKGEGYILSEADLRLTGVRNFKNALEIATNYWHTSTLCATNRSIIRIIFPYDNSGSHELTEAARFGLSLINPNETLVNGGISLDDDRWEKLNGKGVYDIKREELLILNRDLKKQEAMRHGLILTKLGHPGYVEREFARPKEEVEEIIEKTFGLGKREHGYDTMMGQYLPDISGKGVLNVLFVDNLNFKAKSNAKLILDYGGGRFAFVRS